MGIAYGSDVKLAQRLLLEIDDAHGEVLSDGLKGIPKPVALFRGFGDSTLDFELRCFIRDVTRRFWVMSDLNFAIDAAFRDHDITIAFPQPDVRHRNTLPAADQGETHDLPHA